MKAVVTVVIDVGKPAPLKKHIREAVKRRLDGATVFLGSPVSASPLGKTSRLPTDILVDRVQFRRVTIRNVDID